MKLQINYYNEFSKQSYWKEFKEVADLMNHVQEILRAEYVLLDFHSDEKDRWYLAIKKGR